MPPELFIRAPNMKLMLAIWIAFQSRFVNSLLPIPPRKKLVDNEGYDDDDENKDAYDCGSMAVKGVRGQNDTCGLNYRVISCERVLLMAGGVEIQCAALYKSDNIYTMAFEDLNSLTFGAPKLFRYLMDLSFNKIAVMEYLLQCSLPAKANF
ncbi:hypothetical protein IEQ34_002222 [Dendrobium chrysotoxum]|uniref:XPG-I domain-containing protein n=1 Tax=Dendrobium chrysotoxum TaxID=161865 RepID=A0AAV7H4C4_DENCH|nr:hypothetical protein IEQ34_002222 [Dendrobium chrysotoxum]